MSDPALALQKALVDAIKAAETDAGNNVFDTVPPENPFPRITLGEGQSIGVYADCYDGTEAFFQIDIWSQAPGFPEVKRIAGQVRAALHDAELTLDGHTLEILNVQSIDYRREPDNLTSRAIVTVRAQSQPAS